MAEGDPSRIIERAAALVDLAAQCGLIAPPSSAIVAAADRHARVEMLTQALAASGSGAALMDEAAGSGPDFARAFGPLVRIAVFEMAHAAQPFRWAQLRALLLSHFGEAVDPLAPAIYLAALAHPDLLPSAAQLADARRMVEAGAPGKSLMRTARDVGLFD